MDLPRHRVRPFTPQRQSLFRCQSACPRFRLDAERRHCRKWSHGSPPTRGAWIETLYGQIELDLDDGVKVNYLKLGEALATVPGLEGKGEE